MCSEEHLRAISSIQTEEPLREIVLLEEVIAVLYCTKRTNLRNARWNLFKKCNYESERLPPTTGSFKQAVLRAHCHARTWYLSDKCIRFLPNPIYCGWEISEGMYVPITSADQIAPKSVLHLVKCGCNSECLNNRCKCSKSKLVCIDLCDCPDTCENTDLDDL